MFEKEKEAILKNISYKIEEFNILEEREEENLKSIKKLKLDPKKQILIMSETSKSIKFTSTNYEEFMLHGGFKNFKEQKVTAHLTLEGMFMIKHADYDRFNRCVDCKNFILNENGNVNESACAVKKGYVTKNALKPLFCKDFIIIEELP